MSTGEALAVNVLSSNSRWEEKEFQTELRSRLTTLTNEVNFLIP
uniref:Uncharacterized protein n=1 Tax=Rhizophora mucronata TaxID=61149 RepID=A0A2P2MWD3_RHIMU